MTTICCPCCKAKLNVTLTSVAKSHKKDRHSVIEEEFIEKDMVESPSVIFPGESVGGVIPAFEEFPNGTRRFTRENDET